MHSIERLRQYEVIDLMGFRGIVKDNIVYLGSIVGDVYTLDGMNLTKVNYSYKHKDRVEVNIGGISVYKYIFIAYLYGLYANITDLNHFVVNHMDNDSLNDRLSNLEVIHTKLNTRHGIVMNGLRRLNLVDSKFSVSAYDINDVYFGGIRSIPDGIRILNSLCGL